MTDQERKVELLQSGPGEDRWIVGFRHRRVRVRPGAGTVAGPIGRSIDFGVAGTDALLKLQNRRGNGCRSTVRRHKIVRNVLDEEAFALTPWVSTFASGCSRSDSPHCKGNEE